MQIPTAQLAMHHRLERERERERERNGRDGQRKEWKYEREQKRGKDEANSGKKLYSRPIDDAREEVKETGPMFWKTESF